jgi:cell division protein FtsQ
MKRNSVLAHQSIKRDRKKDVLVFKRTLGQLGFGLIKMFLFLLCLGALSMGLILGYHFLASAQWLRVQSIVVTGVEDSVRASVINLSGITDEDSLLSVDMAAVKRNIEEHPWIKAVSVRRKFPHTLHIDVHHEEPVAVVLLDRMCLMNRDGVLFKDIERNDPIDFPIITGLSAGDRGMNEHLRRVASFLTTYSLTSVSLPARELSEIHVEKDGALSVYFNKLPFKVCFGRDDFTRKITSLGRIITHLRVTHRLHHTRSIDMDYHDRGVVAFTDRVV